VNRVRTCLEGVRPKNVEYREYYKNGRRVKEYRVRIELNMDTDEGDPINCRFLEHLLTSLIYPNMSNLGIALCQTNNPPSCPSTAPPNGKVLRIYMREVAGVGVSIGGDGVQLFAFAIDDSTDAYSWSHIILKWLTPVTYLGITYEHIAYISVPGSKEASDIIRVDVNISFRSVGMFCLPSM